MSTILELRSVSKHFGDNRVVDDVSLSVERGAFYALLGPSGCGKTTTLRLIGGFEEATAGDIYLNGARINHLKPYERNVTTVFQNYALFPHLTVRGNIEFGLRRKRMSTDKVRMFSIWCSSRAKRTVIPRNSLGARNNELHWRAHWFWSPMCFCSMSRYPRSIRTLRKQVRLELKALQRRVGITFIFVTHDQEEALSLSDMIALMNRGRIEQTGTPQELYMQAQDAVRCKFSRQCELDR